MKHIGEKVSILVVMDAVLRLSQDDLPLIDKEVSILVVMDAVLRQRLHAEPIYVCKSQSLL